MKAGIINVTGYAGVELARILSAHPEVEIFSVTGRSSAGQLLSHVFPHLDTFDMEISEEIQEDVDIVFSALPHGVSANCSLASPVAEDICCSISFFSTFK